VKNIPSIARKARPAYGRGFRPTLAALPAGELVELVKQLAEGVPGDHLLAVRLGDDRPDIVLRARA
jgi:hypothetical protein